MENEIVKTTVKWVLDKKSLFIGMATGVGGTLACAAGAIGSVFGLKKLKEKDQKETEKKGKAIEVEATEKEINVKKNKG